MSIKFKAGDYLTEQGKLLAELESEYLPKILGFCIMKLGKHADAEDLSQEIALEVIKTINRGKSVENLNALVWSVSNHIFCKYLRRKKYGGAEYLPETYTSDEDIEGEYLRREQENLLHREIARLSGSYREAVVMRYFYGRSCDEIAVRLKTSAGTVKWWLYESRKVIKEGMNIMRDYGEKSYNPGSLTLSCQGTPGIDRQPMSCVERKSAQNILLAAYKTPLTIAELSDELGISAPYIEDEVNYLTKNQLMKRMPSDKYRADFVILPGENVEMADKIYNACFPDYYRLLMETLNANKTLLTSPELNTAGFTWERLLWVYIHIIAEISFDRFKVEETGLVRYEDMPERPRGGKWIALGFDNSSHKHVRHDWKDYQPFDGPVNNPYGEDAQGFFHHWSGLDSNVFFNLPDGIFALCRGIIKGEKSVDTLNEQEKYLFGTAIENRLFIRDGDNFRQNYYFVGADGNRKIIGLANEFYAEAKPYYRRAYDLVLNEYLDGVPDDLHWQMANFLTNSLNSFVPCALYEGINDGSLSIPDENNREWLSLYTYEL